MEHIVNHLKSMLSFGGLFEKSKNINLPEVPNRYPMSLIVNTRTDTTDRNYWVVLFLNSDRTGEYFDPNGSKPTLPEVDEYLRRQCPNGIKYTSARHNDLMPTILHCIGYINEKQNQIDRNLFC